jgi:hypothetical protein
MQELVIPVGADEKDPIEMARIWIAEGRSLLSLNYGIFEERELQIWGSLAADLIAHAVNAALMDGSELTAKEAFALIERGFREQLADNPVLTGLFDGREFQ